VWPVVTAPPSSDSTARYSSLYRVVRGEWPLALSLATAVLFLTFGKTWLADLSDPRWFAFIFAWLFLVILSSAFLVVRHAEALAAILGEPLGTLVLTLAVTGMEVAIIAAVMATGEGNSTVARDAMFAVVMIVLNGMVGLSLLLGGLRHHEQTYNLLGANAFLAVIVPIAVLGLILPNFTVSSPGPTLSAFHSAFLSIMSIGLYGVFLAIQNVRHRDYFTWPSAGEPDHDFETKHGRACCSLIFYRSLFWRNRLRSRSITRSACSTRRSRWVGS
jgi:Ca2+:H+ antiporter